MNVNLEAVANAMAGFHELVANEWPVDEPPTNTEEGENPTIPAHVPP